MQRLRSAVARPSWQISEIQHSRFLFPSTLRSINSSRQWCQQGVNPGRSFGSTTATFKSALSSVQWNPEPRLPRCPSSPSSGEISRSINSTRKLASSVDFSHAASSPDAFTAVHSTSTTSGMISDTDHVHDKQQQNSKKSNIPTPNFNNAKSAYESKTTPELLTAVLAFGLCQIRPIVQHSERLLNLTRRIAGDRITNGILKGTLFGHFCAGEDEQGIKPTIKKLEEAGIGSILDFAAEDDGGNENDDGTSTKATSTDKSESDGGADDSCVILEQNYPKARMYDYESENQCDQHVQTFKQCIRAVANVDTADGFAAIKVTALGNPKLLVRMSRAIVEAQNLFAKFDVDGDGYINKGEFEKGLHLFFQDNEDTCKFKQQVEELMPIDKQGNKLDKVDYITWSMWLQPKDLPKITAGCREYGPMAMAAPTEEEVELIEKLYDRGHALAKEAAAVGTRLLVDAEQQRFQPAIDNLVLDLQRTYNARSETDFPIIYNTYQCYLKDASDRLRADVERSERYDYHFGAKLVRGAYMESERALAQSLGVLSPIHDTIEETHQCYNDAVRFLLEHSQTSKANVEVMCATHNQETIELAIDAMNELGIDPKSRTISFAQLFGMMDNLTFNLGKHGFRAYKYVPYGEVKMVMPYLLRRANENSSISGGAKKELKMITRELRRRMVG